MDTRLPCTTVGATSSPRRNWITLKLLIRLLPPAAARGLSVPMSAAGKSGLSLSLVEEARSFQVWSVFR